MASRRRKSPWWGVVTPSPSGTLWFNRKRLEWLEMLRDAWGDEVVIQIYGGKVRMRSDESDWRFESDAELRAATSQRCSTAASSTRKRGGPRSAGSTNGEVL